MKLRIQSRKRPNDAENAYPDTGRIQAFSDGVFAVAVTLLVFNLKLPDPAAGGGLRDLLLSQWPAFAAYAVSFVTVGIFWANHHYMFHHIERSNHVLGMLNVLFLMCISFLPFSTALVAAFIRDRSQQRTAVFVYVGTFLVSAALFSAVWHYASWNRRLLKSDLTDRFIRRITRRYSAGICAYLAALGVAFWSIHISLGIVVVVALVFFLPTPHVSGLQPSSGP